MWELIGSNISAVFAIAGTIVGALLSFISTYILKKYDMKHRLLEKVLDKRIESHESVLGLAKTMRIMVLAPVENVELNRYPKMLSSRDSFEAWLNDVSQIVNQHSSWLSTTLVRELGLLQDYLVNLHLFLQDVHTNITPK